MFDWCLTRVQWLGRNKEKIMLPFSLLAQQDYRRAKTYVGLIEGDEKIELEFNSLIVHLDKHVIEYIADSYPMKDLLIKLADYYQVSFELYYNAVISPTIGYCEYNYRKKELDFMELEEIDFIGCFFKNGVYYFEGETYPNKYALRKYVWTRKYRNTRIAELLADID